MDGLDAGTGNKCLPVHERLWNHWKYLTDAANSTLVTVVAVAKAGQKSTQGKRDLFGVTVLGNSPRGRGGTAAMPEVVLQLVRSTFSFRSRGTPAQGMVSCTCALAYTHAHRVGSPTSIKSTKSLPGISESCLLGTVDPMKLTLLTITTLLLIYRLV